jgi:tRNA A-37 threonylcarbamoyl transferase component Bud32
LFVLQVTRGPDAGKKLLLEPGRVFTVGCNADASLVLTDPLVLKGHCSLEIADGAVVLKNHTATAGTFVADQKVSQATLKANSSFRIGGTTLSIAAAPSTKPPPAPAPPDPLVGRIVGGYKLNELVGAGGMGKVYRATQLSLHRDVAFKVLRDQHVKDKGFRDLFINEARAAAQLVHPNVVQVYDAGNEGDLVFFSMEFLGQGSTEEILEKEKRIPWEKTILMVLEAAHGLAYAESKGIVHRDIKPDNLMLNEAGQVKIADLGLAKRGEGHEDAGVIGTPHFIAPEQALGKNVDQRADIYSLGATFFRMATGRTLFLGKNAKEIVLKQIKEPPPAASSLDETVPDDLDLVLAKMLAKDPDKRYQSAHEVIAALEEVCAHHGIKGSIIKKGVGKRVLIPLVLLLLVAGAAVYYLVARGPETVVDPAQEAARLKLERLAAERKAENERLARAGRKGEAERKLLRYENTKGDLRDAVPLSTVYTDPKVKTQRELKWLDLARDFEEFAKSEIAREFEEEAEFSSKAQRHADEIRNSLKKWEKSNEDLIEKSAAKVAEAMTIDTGLRRELAGLRAAGKYEKAARLCVLVATGKPAKDDPFAPIVTWEWVSPVDKDLKKPALDFPEIKKIVDESRSYFRNEKDLIVAVAKDAGETAIQRAEALPTEADPDAIETAIKELEQVKNFRDPDLDTSEDKIPEIRTVISNAGKQLEWLQGIKANRGGKLLQADRTAIRDLQRRLCSLDRFQQPNMVMMCEFDKAIVQWNRLLVGDEIKTDLYRRFAKERIAMAGWCEFLFARFYTDLEVTAKGTAPAPLTKLDVELVPFPDGKDVTDAQLVAKDSGRYRFGLNKANAGLNSWDYARFPMDWVYSSIFHVKGKDVPRWREMTPEIHFALGAFCFETMQYSQAAHHFGELLKNGDDKYTKAARSLKARAETEAKARSAYEALLREFAAATTAAQITDLQKKVNAFATEHEGTLFYLDVMDPSEPVKIDFYLPEFPEVPPRPPPPEPRGG